MGKDRGVSYDPFTDPEAFIFTVFLEDGSRGEWEDKTKVFKIPVNKRYDYDYNLYIKSVNSSVIERSVEHVISFNNIYFSSGGQKQMAITGVFPKIEKFDRQVISVDRWGATHWESMRMSFAHCDKLTSLPKNPPDLSRCTDLRGMFYHTERFNCDISNWDVSKVIDMSYMFEGAKNFKQDLNGWDVHKDAKMEHIFIESGLERNPPVWYKAVQTKGDKR